VLNNQKTPQVLISEGNMLKQYTRIDSSSFSLKEEALPYELTTDMKVIHTTKGTSVIGYVQPYEQLFELSQNSGINPSIIMYLLQ
jgi:hypothetical protein